MIKAKEYAGSGSAMKCENIGKESQGCLLGEEAEWEILESA